MHEQEPTERPVYPILKEGQDPLDIAWIACDRCGAEGTPDQFPAHDPEDTLEMNRFTETLLKFGIDIVNNPEQASHVGTVSAGMCCPECGNMAEFDTYSFDEVSKFEF